MSRACEPYSALISCRGWTSVPGRLMLTEADELPSKSSFSMTLLMASL